MKTCTSGINWAWLVGALVWLLIPLCAGTRCLSALVLISDDGSPRTSLRVASLRQIAPGGASSDSGRVKLTDRSLRRTVVQV
ncbi:hypothetical protein BKA70DRAFT_1269185 [Coprinopsis sp. MPI-PUGE-AT-0042]|nr:hypothetical protein BKA70DRAFT_1269185 [Coprinopsis sp. MPI-PUGE-AT-0042]